MCSQKCSRFLWSTLQCHGPTPFYSSFLSNFFLPSRQNVPDRGQGPSFGSLFMTDGPLSSPFTCVLKRTRVCDPGGVILSHGSTGVPGYKVWSWTPDSEVLAVHLGISGTEGRTYCLSQLESTKYTDFYRNKFETESLYKKRRIPKIILTKEKYKISIISYQRIKHNKDWSLDENVN